MKTVLKLAQIGTEGDATKDVSEKKSRGDFWSFLRMSVFDDADPNGRNSIFEERFGKVLSSVGLDNPFVVSFFILFYYYFLTIIIIFNKSFAISFTL